MNYTEATILSGESTDDLLSAPCWSEHILQAEFIT